jgi:hypothetical protein
MTSVLLIRIPDPDWIPLSAKILHGWILTQPFFFEERDWIRERVFAFCSAIDPYRTILSKSSGDALFAWNGALGFWLPVAPFFVRLVFIILPFTLRAIRRGALEIVTKIVI